MRTDCGSVTCVCSSIHKNTSSSKANCYIILKDCYIIHTCWGMGTADGQKQKTAPCDAASSIVSMHLMGSSCITHCEAEVCERVYHHIPYLYQRYGFTMHTWYNKFGKTFSLQCYLQRCFLFSKSKNTTSKQKKHYKILGDIYIIHICGEWGVENRVWGMGWLFPAGYICVTT